MNAKKAIYLMQQLGGEVGLGDLISMTGLGGGESVATMVDPSMISTDTTSRKLFAAISKSDLAAVKLLISSGADVLAIRNGSMHWGGANNPTTVTAVGLSCHLGLLEILKCLCKHGGLAHLCARNSHGMSNMHLAVIGGHLPIMQWLYENGVHTHHGSIDNHWMTPLHDAVQIGRLDLCEWLLKHGAEPSISLPQKKDATHPLGTACTYGHLEIAKLLYASGAQADVTARDKDGYASLHRAKNASVMQWLLENGAAGQINSAAGSSSETKKNAMILQRLRKMSPNIGLAAAAAMGGDHGVQHEMTPLGICTMALKHPQLAKEAPEKIALLKKWGARLKSPPVLGIEIRCQAFASQGNLRGVIAAIRQGANILYEDPQYQITSFWAAANGGKMVYLCDCLSFFLLVLIVLIALILLLIVQVIVN